MEEEAPEGLGGKLDFLVHFAALADPASRRKCSIGSTRCCL